jgi:hypothetical protein
MPDATTHCKRRRSSLAGRRRRPTRETAVAARSQASADALGVACQADPPCGALGTALFVLERHRSDRDGVLDRCAECALAVGPASHPPSRPKLRSAWRNKSLHSLRPHGASAAAYSDTSASLRHFKHEQADQARPNRRQPRLISRYVATRKSVRRPAAAPTIQSRASA